MNKDITDQLESVISTALHNFNMYYTNKAIEFLRKLNVSGFIFVSSFKPGDIPCGNSLACSIGLGGYGIIFVKRDILEDSSIPEKFKEFIIAHEIVHIVRNHVVVSLFIRILFGASLEAIMEIIKKAPKSRELENILSIFFALPILVATTGGFLKADVEEVKRQELEADTIAIQLTGCEGALLFAKLLKELQKMGYNVSHEAALSIPALTIEERVSNLLQQCSD